MPEIGVDALDLDRGVSVASATNDANLALWTRATSLWRPHPTA
jgi:hypothetical protein